jgi:anti-sigma factor RsiW
MNTTTHPVAPEEVMAFLDGELSAEQAQAVAAHVTQCEQCAAVAAKFKGISEVLSSVSAEPASERMTKRVNELANRRRSGEHIRHSSLFMRLSFWSSGQWVLAGSATAVVFLLIVAISLPSLQSSRYVRQKQQSTPVNGRSLNSLVTLSQPGVATDSNGLMHGLGNHAAKPFSVDGQPALDQQSRSDAPMIARTVSVSIVVKDFVTSRANLDAILRRHRGYAANLTANTAENTPRSIEASLRVPAPELDAALADLKALGKVQQEAQSGDEVTQQHADLMARLKNSRETEQRLRAILEQRTGKIKDVLEVEQEIARVRGEIEQMEAEQKNLEHRVDFATVNLSLIEEYKAQLVPPAISAGIRLHNGLVEGYRSAGETLVRIVLFFAEYTLTLLIWALILAFPAFLLWRRFRRSLATAQSI